MSVTGSIMAGVGLAGSIGGAAIQSSAAGHAADTQAQAAEQAAQLQHQDEQDALAFNKQQWNTQQQNMAPWLQAGRTDLATLQKSLPELTAGFNEKFQAPTGATEQNDPGYQFRLDQGMKMLDNSAAAKGGLLSGNTLQGEQNYAQNYASNEYGNVYNRAMGEYTNRFNIDSANKARKFNDLAALSGVGQTTAAQLGQQGQVAADNASRILLTSGQQIGNQMNNAAAARASGYGAGANAWSGALNSGTSSLSNLLLMNQLFGGSNPTAGINLNSVPNPPLTDPAYYGIGG
ncbi:MAG: hypothetical protein ACJ72H_25475 [Candidatus Sulfotelmatobacter sp.]